MTWRWSDMKMKLCFPLDILFLSCYCKTNFKKYIYKNIYVYTSKCFVYHLTVGYLHSSETCKDSSFQRKDSVKIKSIFSTTKTASYRHIYLLLLLSSNTSHTNMSIEEKLIKKSSFEHAERAIFSKGLKLFIIFDHLSLWCHYFISEMELFSWDNPITKPWLNLRTLRRRIISVGWTRKTDVGHLSTEFMTP